MTTTVTTDPTPRSTGWWSGGPNVEEVVGTAAYLCPPEWASHAERHRSARAIARYADADPIALTRACNLARRRLAAGRVRRDVVRLLEASLVVAATRTEERDAS